MTHYHVTAQDNLGPRLTMGTFPTRDSARTKMVVEAGFMAQGTAYLVTDLRARDVGGIDRITVTAGDKATTFRVVICDKDHDR